ncbi:hypothetical protein LINGRAHAP2_LOCUS23015, partial [Linum grandiflorum]
QRSSFLQYSVSGKDRVFDFDNGQQISRTGSQSRELHINELGKVESLLLRIHTGAPAGELTRQNNLGDRVGEIQSKIGLR